MADIIQLLPDHIANQIAAGEVIQRPASVVKELLENAIDAGADRIELLVKDSGKTLVQVIDNGVGMSHTDARMSLERHATSKIRAAEDLFAIRTKGFRGEAMASIAAVAYLEIKTKKRDAELATLLEVAGSTVNTYEHCQSQYGTSIAVKNLFFNIPARRKFLKSDSVEMKHIIDEFERVALAHPSVFMSLNHNGQELFHLEPGNFKKRIIGVFSNRINEQLIPIEEETDILKIKGFVGKPETAKKTRGEQFFFVNDRFIKSNFLHTAVKLAFDDLIQKNSHPSYFIRLELDPSWIDVNIHPTKTEVKFEDDKTIFALLKSAVKSSLGKFNVVPSIDFEQETTFELPYSHTKNPVKMPEISVNPDFNPFAEEEREKQEFEERKKMREAKTNTTTAYTSTFGSTKSATPNWESLYDFDGPQSSKVASVASTETEEPLLGPPETLEQHLFTSENDDSKTGILFQLNKKYIVSSMRSGLLLIHQQRAHERILFEQFTNQIAHSKSFAQQLLFPKELEFSTNELVVLKHLKPHLANIGFEFDLVNANTVAVTAVPALLENNDLKASLEGLIEEFSNSESIDSTKNTDAFAYILAKNSSIKVGRILNEQEMHAIVDELFACSVPSLAPSGLPTMKHQTIDDINKLFEL